MKYSYTPEIEGRVFIQSGLDGAEAQFEWPARKPLGGRRHRCGEAVIDLDKRVFDVKGRRQKGNLCFLREHVCEGRLGGPKSRGKKAAKNTGDLFAGNVEDVA